MNRRRFLATTGAVAFGAAGWRLSAAPVFGQVPAMPDGVRRRIGITSVCFRDRFKQTAGRGGGAATPDLNLMTFPQFVVDNLGLRNVEVWNSHFDEMTLAYAEGLRGAAEKAGTRIINLQLDGRYDLSSPDAARREESITHVKQWMDRTKAVGAPTMRANTGPETAGAAFDVKVIADSFKRLAEYGRTIGVKILVENHVGFSADIDKTVAIVQAVNDPYCRALSDWGNSPATNDTQRAADMSKMFPFLELVSAKELEFDENNQHISYDVLPLIKATEASGYRGIYSIEFYSFKTPPRDVVAAARTMIAKLAANIRPA